MKNWKPIFIENSKIHCVVILLGSDQHRCDHSILSRLQSWRNQRRNKTRHETIHFQQMLETFLIGFIILYCWDYLKGYIKYKNGRVAYFSIRAEQEAYHKASLKFYTEERKRWRWIWDYKV